MKYEGIYNLQSVWYPKMALLKYLIAYLNI